MFDTIPNLPQVVFQDLATATWRQRIRQHDQEDMPDLPNTTEFCHALMKGELDEGLPEFYARISSVEKVYDPDNLPDPIDVSVCVEGYMSDFVEGGKGKNAFYAVVNGLKIDLEPELMDRSDAILIAFSLRDFHNTWEAAIEFEPSLKHPIAPFVEAWFKRPKQVAPSQKRVSILLSILRGARALRYLLGLAHKKRR